MLSARVSEIFSIGLQSFTYDYKISERRGILAPVDESSTGVEIVAIFHNRNKDWEVSVDLQSDYRVVRLRYFFDIY